MQRPVGTIGGVSNPRVTVSGVVEANLQGMIYYINPFNSIGRICTHAGVKLSKIRSIYHQRDMEEANKDPEVAPAVDPKDWPETLETVEEYIRGFRVVDGQPLSYGLRNYLEPPSVANNPTHRANGSKYFTHDEKMITCGSILSGPAVFGSDPEAVGPFTYSFITYRALI